MVASGKKPFELRKNDRNFKAGQKLLLKEFDKENEDYTGRSVIRTISYVLSGTESEKFGLKEGFCILGLENNR